jgi:hypothetical protein
MRNAGATEGLRALLTNRGRVPLNAALRAELVDSLVEISMNPGEDDPIRSKQLRAFANTALLSAANAEGSVRLEEGFEIFRRIFEGTEDAGGKSSAMYAMLQLREIDRSIDFLAGVAVGGGVEASEAIRILDTYGDEVAIERLRRIHSQGSVTDRLAQATLRGVALRRGWKGG